MSRKGKTMQKNDSSECQNQPNAAQVDDIVVPRRYICERCGGTGEQPAGCWNGTAYASDAGKCELCGGDGLLGFIAAPWNDRCGFVDARQKRCLLLDAHKSDCFFE